jgi:hypothetical protein
MAWFPKKYLRNPSIPKTSNDIQFLELVDHFMAKGFTRDEAERNTEEWTGLQNPKRRVA